MRGIPLGQFAVMPGPMMASFRFNVSINMTPLLAAEDFAFMLQARPGCYVWMGNGSMAERGALHSPRYDFNDDALVYGATYWCRLVERLLPLPGATASA